MTDLYDNITQLEHILDVTLPSMMVDGGICITSRHTCINVLTPEATQAVADAIASLCSARLESLEYDAGIRTKQHKLNFTREVHHG